AIAPGSPWVRTFAWVSDPARRSGDLAVSLRTPGRQGARRGLVPTSLTCALFQGLKVPLYGRGLLAGRHTGLRRGFSPARHVLGDIDPHASSPSPTPCSAGAGGKSIDACSVTAFAEPLFVRLAVGIGATVSSETGADFRPWPTTRRTS